MEVVLHAMVEIEEEIKGKAQYVRTATRAVTGQLAIKQGAA